MTRTFLLILLVVALFVPLFQKYVGLPVEDYKLNGYNESSNYSAFSWKDFFEGTYQEKTSTYLQENVGYKGYLIALKNQIDYSVFDKLNYGIENGDDGQLFYWNHIDTHCGHLTLSNDSLQKKIEECKTFIDSRSSGKIRF